MPPPRVLSIQLLPLMRSERPLTGHQYRPLGRSLCFFGLFQAQSRQSCLPGPRALKDKGGGLVAKVDARFSVLSNALVKRLRSRMPLIRALCFKPELNWIGGAGICSSARLAPAHGATHKPSLWTDHIALFVLFQAQKSGMGTAIVNSSGANRRASTLAPTFQKQPSVLTARPTAT